MAATVNSNANAALSPRTSAGEAGGPHAPPRRESPPPWNQSAPYNAALESSVVMGAVSWPSLSESKNVSAKAVIADSSTNPPDSPISAPQAMNASESSSPQSPHKKAITKPNKPNPNPNFRKPARQKSMGRDNGGSDGGFSQSNSVGDTSHGGNALPKTSSGGFDSSGRDHGNSNANREGAQRSGGDRPQQQRTYRRSNSGPHLRGDGSFGGRRDHDRRNNDWSHQRSFNGRDPIMSQQRAGPNGFIRPPPPPPGVASYFPQPLPYGGLMGIPPDMQHLYLYSPPPPPGMPVVGPMPPALYYAPVDPQLHTKIINQIDYYFSNDNLIKDTYLRKNMDEYGWVPIQLIANFKKVMELTTDVQLILDAMRGSTAVEVQGDKIRRRDDWMRWLMPSSAQFATTSASQHPPQMPLSAHVQGLTLEEKQA